MTRLRIRLGPGERVDLVNGSYGIEEFRRLRVAGREILYGVGSAILDNSCCGAFGCQYVLVMGEVVPTGKNAPVSAGEAESIVRRITDPALADAVSRAVSTAEGCAGVNFYLPGDPGAHTVPD